MSMNLGMKMGIGSRQRGATSAQALAALGAASWWNKGFASSGDQIWVDVIAGGVATIGTTTGVDATDPTVSVSPQGIVFASSGKLIQLPTAEKPTLTKTTGSMAVIVVFEAPAASTFRRIYSSTSAADNGIVFGLTNTGLMGYTYGAAAAGGRVFPASSSLRLDDGTIRAAGFTMTDGVMVGFNDTDGFRASATASPTVTGTPAHVDPRVGAEGHSTSNGFVGTIYSYARFSAGLSSTDATAAMTIMLGEHT